MMVENPARIIGTVALIVLIAVFGVLFMRSTPEPAPEPIVTPEVPEPAPALPFSKTVIGTSVLGRPIEAYTFGTGDVHLLFVGGIHGGYEWNSVLLAYEFIDHLTEDSARVPENLTVTVIPNLNPDGVFEVIGKEGRFAFADVSPETGPLGTGRFNAHGVDLNRNFDCKWKPTSTWRGNTVSAGTAPFSEPEAETLRAFVEAEKPSAVVFWHSQANAVYASECEAGVLPGTLTLMNTYALSAGYSAVESFDAYPVSGDAEGWLASIGIPAITVELSTHETLEWERNLTGFTAVLAHYGESALAR